MAEPTITGTFLEDALREKVKAQHVIVTDVSGGCGQAFTAVIVSPQFQSLNSLKRNRLVNAALRSQIAVIHAWSAKCFTPDEWQRKQSEDVQMADVS